MEILDKIDDYFYSHSKRDFIYFLLGSGLLIGFIFFNFIYPYANSFEKETKQRLNSQILKLNRYKLQVETVRRKEIELSKNFKMIHLRLINLKKRVSFYQQLVQLLDFAKFNRQKWANYVKNLIFDAKNDDLRIKIIENKIFKENKVKIKPTHLIVKKVSIGLSLCGDYKNFINYIYKYENTKDLIRIENIKIKQKNNYYIEFVLYGYKK